MATPMMPRPKKPTLGLPSGAFDATVLLGCSSLVILRGCLDGDRTMEYPGFLSNVGHADQDEAPSTLKALTDTECDWLGRDEQTRRWARFAL